MKEEAKLSAGIFFAFMLLIVMLIPGACMQADQEDLKSYREIFNSDTQEPDLYTRGEVDALIAEHTAHMESTYVTEDALDSFDVVLGETFEEMESDILRNAETISDEHSVDIQLKYYTASVMDVNIRLLEDKEDLTQEEQQTLTLLRAYKDQLLSELEESHE